MIESISDGQPNKRKKQKQPLADRLPPHSPEAEQGVLGCLFLEPKLTDGVPLKPSDFYDLRHRDIFLTCQKLLAKNKTFDVITVQQRLKDKNLLEQVGGISYIASLPDAVPSAANLSYYTGIVKEKSELRKIIATCTEVVGKIYDYTGSIDELKFVVQSDLGEVFGVEHDKSGDSSTWNDLLDFETENDANNVIGFRDGKTTRYLCKGQAAWLIGPSGVGKSSLMFQMGVSFAVNKSCWGVTPQRATRVLVVQAENDKGDMAEMAKGIEKGLGLDFNETVNKNVRVRSVTGKIGLQFCAWLRKEIEDFKADLVLVDPLLSFAGIDVSRQDQASQFCRVWLDPVLRDTGAALISVHHTGKPPRRDGKDAPQTLTDMAYAGIGSSELVNWARAVMLLQPAGDGIFRLMFAKRGKRAGAIHPSGEPTSVIWLRHATDGSIFWEQIEPVEEEEKKSHSGAPSKVDLVMELGLGPVIDELTTGVGLRELSRRISNFAAKRGQDISQSTARRAVARLVETKAIKKVNDEYSKA